MCIILLNQKDEYKRAYKSSNSAINIRPSRGSLRTSKKPKKGCHPCGTHTPSTNPIHNGLIQPTAIYNLSPKAIQ